MISTLNKSVFNNGNGTRTISIITGTDSLGKVFQQVLEHLHHVKGMTHRMNLLPFLLKLHHSAERQVKDELFHTHRMKNKLVKGKRLAHALARTEWAFGCLSATPNMPTGAMEVL